MYILGLDIGTTSISAVVFDGERNIKSICRKNDSFIQTDNPWERIQDTEKILTTADSIISELLGEFCNIERIGLTGQQHGIVYVDKNGNAISPLYTWQDGRGDLPFNESETYASHLTSVTGYRCATGYGCVTHYYNMLNGLVPKDAVSFSTIHDYLGMHLCGNTQPLIDASDAASFGLFDVTKGCFDIQAVLSAKISPDILPELSEKPCIGRTAEGIPVFTAIGDNQASFIGAVKGRKNSMLVNLGTGGQFSVHIDSAQLNSELELRPFPLGGFLLVGSSLGGGSSYALLERFFRETVRLIGGVEHDSCYEAMAEAYSQYDRTKTPPAFVPLFRGTRDDSSQKAHIDGLDPDNFTPMAIMQALLYGMVREMYSLYEKSGISDDNCSESYVLFGSGNGLRKNRALCEIMEEVFKKPLILSDFEEEAATGAALYALMKPL